MFLSIIKSHPKIQLIFLLFLFYLVTLSHLPIFQALYLLVFCVGFAIGTDLLFTYIRKRQFFIPYSAAITGLILTLIVDPSASWIHLLVISGVAMGVKNFLRISGRHIFNPAALGLLIGFLVFGLYPSWWAATLYTPGTITFGNSAVLLSVLALAFVSCYRFKRYATVLSFLLSFMVLSALFFPPFSVKLFYTTVLSPGVLFYAIVMLAEPMTSPIHIKKQVMYGSLVALLSIILAQSNLGDSSILALLIGNLLFFKFR